MLFRRAQKAFLVRVGTRLAIVAMGFMTAGLTGILVLISDVIFGGVTAAILGAVTATTVTGLWFGIPLLRRRQL